MPRNHCICAAGFASATTQVNVRSCFSRTSTFELCVYPCISIEDGGAENQKEEKCFSIKAFFLFYFLDMLKKLFTTILFITMMENCISSLHS